MSRKAHFSIWIATIGLPVVVTIAASRWRSVACDCGPAEIRIGAVNKRSKLLQHRLLETPASEELSRGSHPRVAMRDVLFVGRPIHGQANTAMGVFKIIDGGEAAARVTVRFGLVSGSTIEVLDGLKEGDQIILDDMSAWDDFDRIRLR